MSSTAPHETVHRYFELADTFVEVRVRTAAEAGIVVVAGLDRAGYRQLVLRACLPWLGSDVGAALRSVAPKDHELALERLYDICVEVNPTFNIHTVRLRSTTTDPRPARRAEPAREAFEELARRARGLRSRLSGRVVGQDDALDVVARCVERAAAGLTPHDRPLASLLLVGRTGTGKTELARALAAELFDRNGHGKSLVRIDCTEYAEAHDAARLTGAPPGYVGHPEGGQLTQLLHDRPDCVVLFDEIEKAHPRLHHLLLQILEEGELTDGRNRKASFTRSIVVMTSNAGAEDVRSASRAVGFGGGGGPGEAGVRELFESALARRFSPEMLGRIDETVFFRELGAADLRTIARRQLTGLARRSRSRGLAVAFSPAVAQGVAEAAADPDAGAREIRRVLQRTLEPELATRMIAGSVPRGALLRVNVRAGELSFRVEK